MPKNKNDIALEDVIDILDAEVTCLKDKKHPLDIYMEFQDYESKYHVCTRSDKFLEAYLGCRYREESQSISLPPIQDGLEILIQEAISIPGKAKVVTLHRRFYGSLTKGGIVYDLNNSKQQVIKITADSWSAVGIPHGKSPFRFLHRESDLSQVMPKAPAGNLLELLREFIHLDEDSYKLFVTQLVSFFSFKASHYAFILSGGKGTGKSTLSKLVRQIVDPTISDVVFMPQTIESLKTDLSNNYLCIFDNTRPLSDAQSDLLCVAITGGKDVKRKLYTDNTEIIRDLHNVIGINGINVIPTQKDFADRCLLYEPLEISKEERITETEYTRRLDQKLPEIMGSIFTTLQQAMQILPTLKFSKHQRLASAQEEMTAIAIALGMSQDEFDGILKANIDHLSDELERHAQMSAANISDPFVTDILRYVYKNRKISGPVTDVFTTLRAYSSNPDSFPGSASAFSQRIGKHIADLKAGGVNVVRGTTKNYNTLSIFLIPDNQRTKEQREQIRLMNAPPVPVSLLDDEESSVAADDLPNGKEDLAPVEDSIPMDEDPDDLLTLDDLDEE